MRSSTSCTVELLVLLCKGRSKCFDAATSLYSETDVTSGTDHMWFYFLYNNKNAILETLTFAMTYTDEASPGECTLTVFILVDEL